MERKLSGWMVTLTCPHGRAVVAPVEHLLDHSPEAYACPCGATALATAEGLSRHDRRELRKFRRFLKAQGGAPQAYGEPPDRNF